MKNNASNSELDLPDGRNDSSFFHDVPFSTNTPSSEVRVIDGHFTRQANLKAFWFDSNVILTV